MFLTRMTTLPSLLLLLSPFVIVDTDYHWFSVRYVSWTLFGIFWWYLVLMKNRTRRHVTFAAGDYKMAFVCPSVNLSVHSSVCSSVTLSWSLHISWTLWKISLNFGQMFASVSQCAEPISQPCQLKVTGPGHGFEPWISCRLHISYTPGRIFFKLCSYVYLSETMCRTHNPTMPTQGHGHSSSALVWTLNFVSALYLLYQWKDFKCTIH